MAMYDRLYKYTAPLLMAGAIATAPAIVFGAQGTEQGAPTPQVTPTPPAERNIGQETDRGYERSEVEPTDRIGTEEGAPTPEVTPTPPAERNIGQGEPAPAPDTQEALRPDETEDEPDVRTPDPTPQVTPTPPAERNIGQEGEEGK